MIGENVNLIAPVRQIGAEVELLGSSSTNASFAHTGDLVSINIDRTSEPKFFGFGVSHRANIKIRDTERKYDISTANSFKIKFDNIVAFPEMHVTEVHRDEKTNQLSITTYDALDKATLHTVSEIDLTSYTVGEFAVACGALLGVPVSFPEDISGFSLDYPNGANFEGTETIRDALDDIAEVTQTIYFINVDNTMVFKRLDKDGDPDIIIDKSLYFTLDSKTNRRLSAICSATELGDNITASSTLTGTTQYVRDNAFWDLHENRAELVENALAEMEGLTINQFDCEWRGNYLVEIGDKLAFEAKDGSYVYSFLLNDTIKYEGGFEQRTQFEFPEEEETESNPSTLGETLKQTFAVVDKANKQINMVVSETSAMNSDLSQLLLDTNGILAAVTSLAQTTDESLNAVNDELDELTNKVNLAISSEEVEILIQEQVRTGITSVETSTGFKFNETGLTISKTESEISTTITEDGMTIEKEGDEVLTANNQGVKAKDLHATTYLIIGTNSRFEDYDGNRTGCFWIGGN